MKEILGGICLLAVAMGIGRFSYTSLLPFIVASVAVLLASLLVVVYSIMERKGSVHV